MKVTSYNMSKYKNNEIGEIHGCGCQHTKRMDFRNRTDDGWDIDVESIEQLVDDEALGLGWATVIMPCTGFTEKRLVIAANSKKQAVDQNGKVYSETVYHPDDEEIPATY